MSRARSTEAQIELAEGEATPEELDELTSKLRRRLLELDVEDVRRVDSSEAPLGSRGAGASIGALIVSFASPEILLSVVGTIGSWLTGHQNRSVKIAMEGDTLEMTGVSSEEQEKLVAAWIKGHAVIKKADPVDG